MEQLAQCAARGEGWRRSLEEEYRRGKAPSIWQYLFEFEVWLCFHGGAFQRAGAFCYSRGARSQIAPAKVISSDVIFKLPSNLSLELLSAPVAAAAGPGDGPVPPWLMARRAHLCGASGFAPNPVCWGSLPLAGAQCGVWGRQSGARGCCSPGSSAPAGESNCFLWCYS